MNGARRIGALVAVLVVALAVAYLLLRRRLGLHGQGGVHNASQLVKGNLVQVAGATAGSVKGISITPDGQARITIGDRRRLRAAAGGHAGRDPPGVPVRHRQPLHRPRHARGPDDGNDPERRRHPERRDRRPRSTSTSSSTCFDPPTRKALAASSSRARRPVPERPRSRRNVGVPLPEPGAVHLEPAVQRAEPDTPLLQRFIVRQRAPGHGGARQKQQRPRGAGVEPEQHRPTRSAARRASLADAIGQLPDFMRQANTTFVNLRSALDDVDPLVDASKPVARSCGRSSRTCGRFARDARPTVRDLAT